MRIGRIHKKKQTDSTETVPAKRNNNEESSYYSVYSEYLYYSKIEAWMYGPVLPIVYKEQDIDKYYNPQFIKENFVKESTYFPKDKKDKTAKIIALKSLRSRNFKDLSFTNYLSNNECKEYNILKKI